MVKDVRTRILTGLMVVAAASAWARPLERPSVVFVTVDALRADRVSAYGYERPTTPNIDRLLSQGVRFTAAHTVEPLTAPALTSMVTGLPPEDHGSTRNGLRMAPGLDSLPKELARLGWKTAAFVGNWTLKDHLTGLAEHFDDYEGVFSRRRWFGLFNREATAGDLTDAALEWVRSEQEQAGSPPFFLWVHYVEPHAPYRYQEQEGKRLGIPENADRSARYDTEVATADRELGRLLGELRKLIPEKRLLVVFSADHGESLGEHDYWGHGRHLYEPTLWIPMGLAWPGHVAPRTSDAPAVITDLAPTVLGLIGIPTPDAFTGRDWSGMLRGGAEQGADRLVCVQAHKGAVKLRHESDRARSQGLLEIGALRGRHKELYRLGPGSVASYDLDKDPGELTDLTPGEGHPSKDLQICIGTILDGLGRADELGATVLDKGSVEQLKSLGYLQ